MTFASNYYIILLATKREVILWLLEKMAPNTLKSVVKLSDSLVFQ
nr:MAG TPA: hypothetical protein [Caudoviricetes sp.]